MKYKNITKGRGDKGFTDLCLGGSVMKTDERIETVGEIDEFHATMGLCHNSLNVDHVDDFIKIQSRLTNLMGEIACEDCNKEKYLEKFGGISAEDIDYLDSLKDDLAEELDASSNGQSTWSLYGQTGLCSAKLDHSVTVCRRCERRIIGLKNSGFLIRDEIFTYMNRLSKVLYLLARWYEKS